MNNTIEIDNKKIVVSRLPTSRLRGMRRRLTELENNNTLDVDTTRFIAVINEELSQRESESKTSLELYETSKNAPRGAEVVCPHCMIKFTKKTKSQAFCSNARSHGRDNCKDGYWNSVRNKD